jgi:hypothetical protein
VTKCKVITFSRAKVQVTYDYSFKWSEFGKSVCDS